MESLIPSLLPGVPPAIIFIILLFVQHIRFGGRLDAMDSRLDDMDGHITVMTEGNKEWRREMREELRSFQKESRDSDRELHNRINHVKDDISSMGRDVSWLRAKAENGGQGH